MGRFAGGTGTAETYVPLNLNISLPLLTTGAPVTVFNKALGFKFRIASVIAQVSALGTGAGATRVLNVNRSRAGTPVNVATMTVTLASTDTGGEDQTVTMTPANAEFEDSDNLLVSAPAGGTVFTAGELNLIILLAVRPQARSN